MRELNDPLDTLELSDFDNHRLRQSYLGAYGVEVVASDPNDHFRYYTMCWKHGFMMATPEDWGQDTAEVWAFYFVWHWLRGLTICYFDDSDRKGSKDVASDAAYAYYKHKTRFGKIHPKKEKSHN